MKKLITLAISLLFSVSVFAVLTTPYSNFFDGTNTLQHKDKITITVKNQGGAAIAAGTLVGPDLTKDDGASVATIVASALVSQALCMVEKDIAASSVGSCLVWGYTDALLFDASTTAVAGEAVFAGSATAGYSLAIASGSIATYHRPIGIFLDASSTLGAVEAFINML